MIHLNIGSNLDSKFGNKFKNISFCGRKMGEIKFGLGEKQKCAFGPKKAQNIFAPAARNSKITYRNRCPISLPN